MSFFFQAEDGIRDYKVTGVQTCALPISDPPTTLEPAPLALGDSGVLALAPAAAPAVVNAQALASAGAAAVRASETQYLPTISLGAGYSWSNDGRVKIGRAHV